MGQLASNVYYETGIHAGQLWKQYDFEGQITEHFYDDFGRTTGKFYFAESATDPAMGVLFTYNSLGQLVEVTETHGIDITTSNYPSAFLPPLAAPWRVPWLDIRILWLASVLLLVLAVLLAFKGTGGRTSPSAATGAHAPIQRRPRPRYPALAPHYRYISLTLIVALLLADPNLQTLWTAHAQITPPTNDDETRTTTFTFDFEGRLTQVAAPEGTIHYG